MQGAQKPTIPWLPGSRLTSFLQGKGNGRLLILPILGLFFS